jgi:tetratricopeptide (TPR) repeat protein
MSSSDLRLSGELPPAESWTPSVQQVRSLVLSHYQGKRYYDQSAAQSIAVLKVGSDPVYECVLETLVEHRAFEERLEPHDGSSVEEKAVPPLWDVQVKSPGFKDSVETIRIPGTEKVRKCGTCKHQGKVVCSGCNGAGRLRCKSCKGTGKNCKCDGGYHNCQTCNGRREVECPVCHGFGDVASYTALVARFSVTHDRKANREIPASYRDGLSTLTLEAVGRGIRVEDLGSLPPLAKDLAKGLVEKAPVLPTEPADSSDHVLRKQRLVVSLLKNVAVRYRLDGQVGEFSVVGNNRKMEGLPVRRNYGKVGRHVAIAVGGIVVLIAALFLYQWYSRERQYREAGQLLDAGASAAALAIFDHLSDAGFKDSARRAKEASFAVALSHMENGRYAESIKLLGPLQAESWPGSEEALNEARYKQALGHASSLVEKGNFAEAIKNLEMAQSINPTPEIEQEVKDVRRKRFQAAQQSYEEGNKLSRAGSYAQAIAVYKAALRIDPTHEAASVAMDRAQRQMRRSSASQSSARTRRPAWLEAGAIISSNVTSAQVEALRELVRLHGYRCDSVSAAAAWLLSPGYTLTCNRYRYRYSVEDKGGIWTVGVE